MLYSITLFGLSIQLFSILFIVGALIGNWSFGRYARKWLNASERQLTILHIALVATFLLGGWLGHTLLYTFVTPDACGGYTIMGSVIFMALTMPLLARMTGLEGSGSGSRLADIVSVAFLPTQIIGKFGCLAAGCCYGTEWSGPFAIAFPAGVEAPAGIYLHPVQVYEALGLFIVWLICWWMLRRNVAAGLVTGIFLIGKGLERFLTELLRGDVVMTELGISTAQIASIACIAVGATYIFLRKPAGADLPTAGPIDSLESLEKSA